MLVNESSLRVISWGDAIVKLSTKNACCFNKYWKRSLVKKLLIKIKKALSILHRLRIKQLYDEDFILLKISTLSLYQLQLEAYYILLHPKLKIKSYTHLHSTFLFCSLIVEQLLSTSLKR